MSDDNKLIACAGSNCPGLYPAGELDGQGFCERCQALNFEAVEDMARAIEEDCDRDMYGDAIEENPGVDFSEIGNK